MFTGIGTFTIVEVKDGKGSSEGRGRLKSGAGWIALSLVKRVLFILRVSPRLSDGMSDGCGLVVVLGFDKADG